MDWKFRKKIINPPADITFLANLFRAHEAGRPIDDYVIGKAELPSGLKGTARCYCFQRCQKPLESKVILMTVRNTKPPTPMRAFLYFFHEECYKGLLQTG